MVGGARLATRPWALRTYARHPPGVRQPLPPIATEPARCAILRAGQRDRCDGRTEPYGEMPMRQRLSVVTLGVRDIARARQFYENGLGWHCDFGQDDVAMYQSGGMVFALYEWPKLAEDAGVAKEGTG